MTQTRWTEDALRKAEKATERGDVRRASKLLKRVKAALRQQALQDLMKGDEE